MDLNQKDIRFDDDLQVEVYQFTGVVQNFPNHFHEYYVIGLIETGQRRLTVNHQDYNIGPGDLMTFNPMDNHACEQTDSGTLSYRCLNIKPEIMAGVVSDIWKHHNLPKFREPLQYRTELAPIFRELHTRLMDGAAGLEKEELFLLFMEQLITAYARFEGGAVPKPARQEIEEVCAYLEEHYAERISLDRLGHIAGLNKYTLLRAFTRLKGITPYRYLEAVRISKAKELLEQGVEPAEAALATGFSDQSHFTSYFNKLIGLTPGQYQAIFREDTI